MPNQKVLKNKSLDQIKIYERISWLLPIPMTVLLMVKNYKELYSIITSEYTLTQKLGLIVVYFILGIFLSIIPFIAIRVYLHHKKKQAKLNSTFIPTHDFDYYRERLIGLTPGEISLISDLQIEQNKDVSACILKYTEMGILKQINGQYVSDNFEQANIKNSDKYLIYGLTHNIFNMNNDTEWKKLVEQEAVEAGYITNHVTPEIREEVDRRSGGGCLITILAPFVFWGVAVALFIGLYRNMGALDAFTAYADSVGDNSTDTFFEIVTQYPEAILFLIAAMLMFLFVLIGFAAPIFSIAGYIGFRSKWNLIRRTEKGNEMADCICGMKSFIHDFTLLSEAAKEQVLLWDDYLIYAVVLEENEQIVNDIYTRRKNRFMR